MKRVWVILLFFLGVILVMGIVAYSMLFGFGVSTESEPWRPMTVTQENVAEVLSHTRVIQEVPSDGELQAYIGDVAYIIGRSTMKKGISVNPDMTVRVPESYLTIMGEHGPCAALTRARVNGDLMIELHGSQTGAAWKYRALFKYRSCLGL